MTKASEPPAVLDGIRRGLKAKQLLLAEGHGPLGKNTPAGFPAPRLRDEALAKPPQAFVHAQVPGPNEKVDPESWTILGESAVSRGGKPAPLFSEAALVALHGLSALSGMPSLQLGVFSTVARQEIEALRILHRLVADYERSEPQKKPLSLAVFGAPGAGKSFIVNELARSLFGEDVPFLVFNLSQFSNETELTGAFHRVRDEVLRGRTPVVFWDEFDVREYHWLQFLLAPMQDGAFQEGQVTHPVGKCVFVFAGGTSATLEAFGPREDEKSKSWQDFKLKKGPDFISRLHGHLDILGPNPRQLSPANRRAAPRPDPADICFPIRRALILRGKVGLKPSEPLDIDRGLLTALLRADGYAHGTRSFEKIAVALCQGGFPLRRSSLPPRQLLQRELAGQDAVDRFYRLMERHRADQAVAEQALAQARQCLKDRLTEFAARIHAAYLEAPEPSADMRKEFKKLDLFAQESNRAAVQRIPEVLGAIGLQVLAGPPNKAQRDVAANRLERFIELAAATEHQGWMDFHFRHGWKHEDIPTKDTAKKLHPALVPYEQLAEVMKEKDRRQVRIYLDLVHQMGFKVAQL